MQPITKRERGMEEKSKEFVEEGAEVYAKTWVSASEEDNENGDDGAP